MFQVLVHEATQRSILYQKNTKVPYGTIPNVMCSARYSNVEDMCYVSCMDYVPESNALVTSVGEIAISTYEKHQVYFNSTSSDVYVYGQKLPETHALIDLPEEFNNAPETASWTQNEDGTYTFTQDAAAVAGHKRSLLHEAIEERNRKLTASDWTQVTDSPLSDEKKEAWRVYRQALRDFPNTYTGAPEDWRASFPAPP